MRSDDADPSADPSTLAGVGFTALMVAATRAAESARPDRLFSDPYALDFVRAGGFDAGGGKAAAEEPETWGSFVTYAAIRTRFFDDYVESAARTIRQVVIVAAGLDTRAYRLDLPTETMVYEVDTADMLTFKQHVLDDAGARPACRRIPVATDLRQDWVTPLRAAGFDHTAPTAWLIEGLLPYLRPADNDRLLEVVTGESAPGSQLSIEFITTHAVQLMVDAQGGDEAPLKSLWSGGGVDDESQPWLGRHGWQSQDYDVYAEAERHDRPLPPLGDSPIDRFSDAARRCLVVARR